MFLKPVTRNRDFALASFVHDAHAFCKRTDRMNEFTAFHQEVKLLYSMEASRKKHEFCVKRAYHAFGQCFSLDLRWWRIIHAQDGGIAEPFTTIMTAGRISFFGALAPECIISFILNTLGGRTLGRLASTCKWFRDTIGAKGLVYARERFESKLATQVIKEKRGRLRVLTYDEKDVVLHMVSRDGGVIGLEYDRRFYIVKNDLLFRRVITAAESGYVEEIEFGKLFEKLLDTPFDLVMWADVVQGDAEYEILVHLRMYGDFDNVIEKKHKREDCIFEFSLVCHPSKWGPMLHDMLGDD
jgi:hypothetical protein